MLTGVTNLIVDTQKIIDDFNGKQNLDKHWIDFQLCNTETIDLILTKAEAQLEGILSWREFKQLEGLDEKYEKIGVIFDSGFEEVAGKLCTINGWQKRDGKIENKIIVKDLSGDMKANYSFDSKGNSLELQAPDISRISFEYEQTNTSGGAIKPMKDISQKDVFMHTSMEDTGCGSL